MPITEQDRRDAHEQLTGAIGEQCANTIMDLLPSQPLSSLATRDDVERLGASLRLEMGTQTLELQSQITELRSDMTSIETSLRSEMTSLDTSLRGELLGVETRLRSEWRSDMSELRTEFRSDMSGLRNELQSEMSELRTELRSDMSEFRTEFRTDMSELRTDMGHVSRETTAIRSEMQAGFEALTTSRGQTLATLFGTAVMVAALVFAVLQFDAYLGSLAGSTP